MSTLCVVLIGGLVNPTSALRAALRDAAVVIAADSGLAHAGPLGLRPDLLVGDLDSVSAAVRSRYPGLPTIEYPRDKDALDVELALNEARARGAERIALIGGLRGRLDQALANLLIVQGRHALGGQLSIDDGVSAVLPLREGEQRQLNLASGTPFSLLPLDASAEVTLTGADYRLDKALLERSLGRGVSNVARGPLSLTLHRGALLVISDAPSSPALTW